MIVASSDGVEIAVHHLGGDGPPLLISHATGFHGRAYAPLAAVLSARFEVFAIDYRGHGASGLPGGDRFDWAGMVDDLLAVADALGRGPLRLVGHSMGGAVALAAELRRPGTVTAAHLFEPIIVPPLAGAEGASNSNAMAATARRRNEVFASRAAALWRYASRPPLGELRADSLHAYVEHGFVDLDDGTVRLACRAASEAATFEGAGVISIDDLPGLGLPVTVAVGRAVGAPDPSSFAPPIAEALPRGTLVRYPLLGHFGPLQDPETIAAAIIDSFD